MPQQQLNASKTQLTGCQSDRQMSMHQSTKNYQTFLLGETIQHLIRALSESCLNLDMRFLCFLVVLLPCMQVVILNKLLFYHFGVGN